MIAPDAATTAAVPENIGVIVADPDTGADVFRVLIPQGWPLGQDVEETLLTYENDQTQIDVELAAGGESPTRELGVVHLPGVPPAAAGQEVRIRLRLSADGLLTGQVTHLPTGRSAVISINTRPVRTLLQWRFRRGGGLLNRLGLQPAPAEALVIRSDRSFADVSALILVGKVNRMPDTVTDGRVIWNWVPTSEDRTRAELVVALSSGELQASRARSAEGVEMFCRLFAEPSAAVTVWQPPPVESVL